MKNTNDLQDAIDYGLMGFTKNNKKTKQETLKAKIARLEQDNIRLCKELSSVNQDLVYEKGRCSREKALDDELGRVCQIASSYKEIIIEAMKR